MEGRGIVERLLDEPLEVVAVDGRLVEEADDDPPAWRLERVEIGLRERGRRRRRHRALRHLGRRRRREYE